MTIGGAHNGQKSNSIIVYGYNWSSRLDRSDQLQQLAIYLAENFNGCSVYGDTLQYIREERVSHRRTRQVTVCVIIFTQREAIPSSNIGAF